MDLLLAAPHFQGSIIVNECARVQGRTAQGILGLDSEYYKQASTVQVHIRDRTYLKYLGTELKLNGTCVNCHGLKSALLEIECI